MTRLLKTAIIGPSETIVDSSWIDMLAGLSPWGILRMPPDFCATAAPDAAASASTASIAARPHRIALLDDLMAALRDALWPLPFTSKHCVPGHKSDQVFDGDQLYTRVSVSPISAERSLSDRRSVTRNASTPCS